MAPRLSFRGHTATGTRLPIAAVMALVLLLPALPAFAQVAAEAPAAAPLVPTLSASRLAARLDAIWDRESLPRRSYAGFAVIDPSTGDLIYSRNADLLFTPASNTKLYSTALAISRLGPEYRLETELRMNGEFIEATGRLKGDLVLIGKGDPSLSGRIYPYARQTANQQSPSIPALDAFVDAALARGIRIVDGDIVGDDTAYLWEPFHEGWAQDDALYDYGAPVSALSLNDNAVRITVRAGHTSGELADITVQPDGEFFDVLNEVNTVEGATPRLDWERIPGQRVLLIRGELPPRAAPRVLQVAVDDPAQFTAHVLRQTLLRRGIVVRGQARARHRLPAEESGASVTHESASYASLVHLRLSPPLSELITVVNKESQNLHAELLLCEVVRARDGTGSRTRALADLRGFLASLGISPLGITFADASGLARLNLVSPEATARLLAAMWRGEHRDVWLASLPIGGQDGTLRHRFSGSPFASAISAKTGTLRGVTALSGYVRTRSGKLLAFSGMVNNHGGPGSQGRAFLDKIVLGIAAIP